MKPTSLPRLFDQLPADAVIERRIAGGGVVFRQGSKTGGLWFVHQGRVDLQRVTDAGHPVLIHRAGPNEMFAEASLFSERYHCTAISVGESIVTQMNRASVLEAMRTDPEFAISMSAMLARQVQAYRRLIEILSIRKAEDRVFEAAAQDMLGSDLKAFSARIGLTHETVYRALARLTEQGRMIKSARGVYAVCRPATGTHGKSNER